ncbi:MAG TPA: helix-turn-helix domain-containing protein [Burkholderiaceae bacterium]|nr:helix-turn-helix domain-containing protein [Burkholderiaceae bacterium]
MSNAALQHRRGAGAATAARLRVPSFSLYGERAAPGVERLHVEDIQSRSRLYRWEIEPHVHHALYQVLWIGAGSAETTLDVAHQVVRGPAAVVVPPGVVHGFRFAPETDGHVLSLSAGWPVGGDVAASEAFQRLFEAPAILAFGDAAAGAPEALDARHAQQAQQAQQAREAMRVQGLVVELAHAFGDASSDGAPLDGAPLAGWLAQAVVWRLARRLDAARDDGGRPSRRGREALFARFARLVEEHYVEHWPVSRYASRLGVSVERLNRLAQGAAGATALEFIHRRLAREACRRLVYIAAPISRLAFELGFEDPAYFCRFFKRRFGEPPSDFRARHGANVAAPRDAG